eukprot:5862537-Prymnesium_polylepis.1
MFHQLGERTLQAEQLAGQQVDLSAEELLRKAEVERERLEAIGELDRVGDRQPKKAPSLGENLVGTELEIRWRYWKVVEGEFTASGRPKKKQVFIWCTATVIQVADGTVRKSARSEEALPAGAVRLRFAADEDFDERDHYVWSILNPEDWRQEVPLGWRWAPAELERQMASEQESATK